MLATSFVRITEFRSCVCTFHALDFEEHGLLVYVRSEALKAHGEGFWQNKNLGAGVVSVLVTCKCI